MASQGRHAAPDPLADLVARHARTRGPFSSGTAAARFGVGVAVVDDALRRLAGAGRVVSGEFRPGGRGEEWCDAGVLRLLRRRSLARLRKEVEPVPPEVLAAFLPAWHGVAPIGQPGTGPGTNAHPPAARSMDALVSAIERLQGAAIPASALETLVLPGRVPGYSPALLDELTSSGEVVWVGQGSLPGGDGWVSLYFADTAPLLLPAPAEITMTPLHEQVLEILGGGGALFFRELSNRIATLTLGDVGAASSPADAARARRARILGHSSGHVPAPAPGPEAPHPGPGAHRPDPGVLPDPGAHRPDPAALPVPARTAVPDDQVLAAALWDLVWAGRVTGDTLAPLRSTLGAGRPAHRPPVNRRRRAVLPTRSGPPTVSGRWWLLPPPAAEGTQRAHAQAEVLLERHGVITRGGIAAERLPGGFSAVYQVLRAFEEGGRCRRGYFVEGLGGAQFALPGAVDRMRAMTSTAPPQPEDPWASPPPQAPRRVVVLAATDPANPYGAALPWPERTDDVTHKPGRKAGALVVLVEGVLVLYVERGGKTLLSFGDSGDLRPAVEALAISVRRGALGKLTVERADGTAITDSPLAAALEAAGFHPTPRGLRIRA